MMRIVPLALAAILLAGCQSGVTGTPVSEPQRVHCDLIFPGPDHR